MDDPQHEVWMDVEVTAQALALAAMASDNGYKLDPRRIQWRLNEQQRMNEERGIRHADRD